VSGSARGLLAACGGLSAFVLSGALTLAQGNDIVVPIHERHGSGVRGQVTVHPQGHSTVVRVNMFAGPAALRPKLSLEGGNDCLDSRAAATRPIPLNPISTGQVSRTFVSIPIESFRKSNFVVDVRDATNRQRYVEGCAQLGR
jgi:hypothetical protein